MSFPGEQIFHSSCDIKYLFQPSSVPCPYLIVVFSALNVGLGPFYNYINALDQFKCNKLFILDDQCNDGCFYIGHNRNHVVEDSTIQLIYSISNQLSIPLSKIIAVGTSKGGFASLYFGIKYHFGYVLSGAPQTLLGNYLIDEEPTTRYIATYIAGGITEDDKKYLNHLIYDAVKDNTTFPEMYFHVGMGDFHYQKHLIPLMIELNAKGAKYSLNLGDYVHHQIVGEYFEKYILTVLPEILSKI